MIRRIFPTPKELAAFLAFLALIVGAGALVIWLSWRWFDDMDAQKARAWAYLATALVLVLVPTVGTVCYRLGKTASNATILGLDMGVNRVMGAAGRVVSSADQVVRAKVGAAQIARQADPVPGDYQVLLPGPGESFSLRHDTNAGQLLELE